MNWEIKLPYRRRDDSLSDCGALANQLETDEDRAVAQQLVLSGLMAGLSTAGELADRVEKLDKGDRRRLLDAARRLAGLEPIETVETRQKVERASLAARRSMAHHPGPLRLAYTPSGAIVDLDEQAADAARERAAEASRRAAREA